MNTYNKIAGLRPNRIEGLSDGIFSIAMTFLVFNLKDPFLDSTQTDAKLIEGLISILPNILAFFMSFMTLGIFWMGHSTQFHYIEKSDRNLHWISILFLMFVSLLPFTTSFLGSHINNVVSIWLYWINIFSLGIMLLIHWSYATKNGLVNSESEQYKIINQAIKKRIYTAQSIYFLATLLSFFSTYLSIVIIILVQLNYAFAFFEKKK